MKRSNLPPLALALSARRKRAVPIGNPGQWARPQDYPKAKIDRGTSAYVVFRATVDAAGQVADCVPLEATSPPTIGAHTCALIKKRGRFAPSLDKDGKPVADYYINRVYWQASS